MPDKFDPYREALVIETQTVWPDAFDDWDSEEKRRVADSLHADPAQAAQLEYLRMHTGFCRTITVTDDDVERVSN